MIDTIFLNWSNIFGGADFIMLPFVIIVIFSFCVIILDRFL